jgi:hypothetical protein
MRNLARKHEPKQEVFQDVGTVVRVAGAASQALREAPLAFAIRVEDGEIEARRATSCLLEPMPGDRVLVVVTPDRESYVLAVLERQEGTAGVITADGDLDIRLRHGRLGVAAQEGVSVVSGKDVSVVSGGVAVRAVEGNVALQRLSFVSTFLRAELEKAKVLAGSLDTMADRLMQRVKRSYRFVEESDHLRAESIDHVAKGTVSVHGANALITAEALVKVDGDQIHLG